MISSFLKILFAFTVYGVIHSLLAALKAKDLAITWFGLAGRRWYRLAYNLFSVITLLPILALAVILPDQKIYTIPFPINFLLYVLQLAGVVVMIIAVQQTDLLHFAGFRQAVDKSEGPEKRVMQTGGLYRYVRHPIYTGGLIFLWASPEMSWNSLALKISFTLYFIFGAMVEEKKLVAEFGDEYRWYRLKTPMLIPGRKKHK